MSALYYPLYTPHGDILWVIAEKPEDGLGGWRCGVLRPDFHFLLLGRPLPLEEGMVQAGTPSWGGTCQQA